MLREPEAPLDLSRAFHEAFLRLDTSRCDRDEMITVATRQDADGVRIVIQDPLEATAFSLSAVRIAAPPQEPLGPAQVPSLTPGISSGWESAVAQRTTS